MKNDNYAKFRIKTIIERNIRNIVMLNTKDLGFVSINKIEINNDLSLIKIYVSFLNENSHNLFDFMQKKVPYFRCELANKMSLRKVPNIMFVFDDRFIVNKKMDELLKKNN